MISPDLGSITPDNNAGFVLSSEFLPVMNDINRGTYFANEKFSFSALRDGQVRRSVKSDLQTDLAFKRGIKYFLDQFRIPYEKSASKALSQPPNPALMPGACYAIYRPGSSSGNRIMFSGITEYDRRRLRPTIVTFSLNFDNNSEAKKLLDEISSTDLRRVTYPLLREFFTVQSSQGKPTDYFSYQQRQMGLDPLKDDSFNIPVSSIVVGEQSTENGNMSIHLDTRARKTFV